MNNYRKISELIEKNKSIIIDNWVTAITVYPNSTEHSERSDCAALLEKIINCLKVKVPDPDIKRHLEFKLLEQELISFASYRALNDFTPTQTANYLLTLKQTVYSLIASEVSDGLQAEFISFNNFIDDVAVLAFQIYYDAREEVIRSQAHALEHDTPIVKISASILLMPIMGIIDTLRAQKIIESLLTAVVSHQAEIAILDMTAVPTFDTHVANNILKTIKAAKMVGTQAVLSGITPSVAMTIVKLGVDLSQVYTFNTLENAIAFSYNSAQTTSNIEA
ncbi:STAS domain-containing protein [Colwelliaceae bacterium MEBiC 14330]